jgi:metal-sulfur cluster biosynthetic enzyme
VTPDAVASAVIESLDRVVDPCSIATGVPINLREMGLVRSAEVSEGHATVRLVLTSPFCWQMTNIVEAVERAAAQVPGVTSCTCEIDPAADWMPDMMSRGARARLRQARPLSASQRDPGSAPGTREPHTDTREFI